MKAGVRNLAKFSRGNDVGTYCTRTRLIREGKPDWAGKTKEMTSFRLYRMSLETCGRPLLEFKSALELLTAIRDAMRCRSLSVALLFRAEDLCFSLSQGHDEAYFKAQILHRDISVGNIMIDKDGHRFVIDWDLCTRTGNSEKGPRRPERTVSLRFTHVYQLENDSPERRSQATWQFLSLMLLDKPQAAQTLEDDRESVLWILLWVVPRYFRLIGQQKCWKSPNDLFQFKALEHRGNFFTDLTLRNVLALPTEPGICGLIENLGIHFSWRYQQIDRLDPRLTSCQSSAPGQATPASKVAEQVPSRLILLKLEGFLVEYFDAAINALDDSQKAMPPCPERCFLPDTTTARKRKADHEMLRRLRNPLPALKDLSTSAAFPGYDSDDDSNLEDIQEESGSDSGYCGESKFEEIEEESVSDGESDIYVPEGSKRIRADSEQLTRTLPHRKCKARRIEN